MRKLFETHCSEVVRLMEQAIETKHAVMSLGFLYLAHGRLQAAQRDMVTEAQKPAEEPES